MIFIDIRGFSYSCSHKAFYIFIVSVFNNDYFMIYIVIGQKRLRTKGILSEMYKVIRVIL